MHATILALDQIYRWLPDLFDTESELCRRACDWERESGLHPLFGAGAAATLLDGGVVDLPDCPRCAVLVDLALALPQGLERL